MPYFFNWKRSLPYIIMAGMALTAGFIILLFLPHNAFARGFLGDAFVVVFLYGGVKALFPELSKYKVAAGVFSFALFLEVLQYFKVADHLELTGVARTIVGATFDLMDIVAYALGLILCVIYDRPFGKNNSARKNY